MVYLICLITGPNELSVVDVRAVSEVLGAGGLDKGECEQQYLLMNVANSDVAQGTPLARTLTHPKT